MTPEDDPVNARTPEDEIHEGIRHKHPVFRNIVGDSDAVRELLEKVKKSFST